MYHLNTCSLLNKIALSLICQNLVWNRVTKLQYFVVWYRINKDFCDPEYPLGFLTGCFYYSKLTFWKCNCTRKCTCCTWNIHPNLSSNNSANIILNCQVDLNDYGIDWDGPLPNQEWDGQHQDDDRTVEVPSTSFPLSQQVFEHLQRTIDPLRNTQYHGVDIYNTRIIESK